MKKAIALIATALIFLTYAISLSLRNPAAVPSSLDTPNHPGFYDYRGIVNVQSTSSGGFLSAQEIVRAGQDGKLDFIIFNELNRFVPGGISDGWQRQLLVLNGSKYSYLESRILALNPERLKSVESLGQAQTTIADLLSREPESKRFDTARRLTSKGPAADLIILGQASRDGTEWAGILPNGISGIEVLNIHQAISRMWRDARLSLIWSSLIYPFNAELALIRLFADLDTTFENWDRLSRDRPIFGLLGSDAGMPSPILGVPVRIPSYETIFALASNHVLLRSELTGDFESDRNKLLNAIMAGQSYMSFDLLGPTKGFAAWHEDAHGIHSLGSRPKLDDRSRIMVRLPKKPEVPFETVVLRDGISAMTSNSTETEFRVHQPGVYRIVVRLFISPSLFDGGRWIPWIMTNPIVVLPR